MYREETPYTEVRESENSYETRLGYWRAAEGLQAVDGLEVSEYGRTLGRRYVEGEASAERIAAEAAEHYASSSSREHEEADIVAARITLLLETTQFVLSPRTLYSIHSTLFRGVFRDDWVGVSRTVNLAKKEPVLGGRSVIYADFRQIPAQLDYDFGIERAAKRREHLLTKDLSGLATFVGNVWQTHPFREGNTRTIAVFTELYLRSLGFLVNNEPFAEHSVYFRDALVRANFSSLELDVDEEHTFLERILSNIVLGTAYDLTADDLNVHGIRQDLELAYRPVPDHDIEGRHSPEHVPENCQYH